MQADQLLKVVDLRELLFEDGPLALDNGNHDVLVNRPQEVLHLLPQKLQFPQLSELLGRDPLLTNKQS